MSSRMVSYWNRLDNKYFNLQKTLNYTLAVFRRRGQEHSNINQSKYLIPLVEPGPLSVHSIIFTLVKTKAITFIDTIHIYESIHIFTYDSGVFIKLYCSIDVCLCPRPGRRRLKFGLYGWKIKQ